jgi:hypothetical protein
MSSAQVICSNYKSNDRHDRESELSEEKMDATMIDSTGESKQTAKFPRWKRAARPAVEAVRTIGYLAAVWRGHYMPAQHSVKMRILKSWVPNPGELTLVESGTYLADTVLALRHTFRQVISIEIDPALHEIAKARTAGATNVELILGDCVKELPALLSKLDSRAVFWLDGHWSGGVTGRGVIDDPILVSLNQIAGHSRKDHILFIDDARTFQGGNGAPDLVEVLLAIRAINPDYRIVVHSDIVVATPER